MQTRIERLNPAAALPGADVQLSGQGLFPDRDRLPEVRIGELAAPLIVGGPDSLLVRVPEAALSGLVEVRSGRGAAERSNGLPLEVAVTIAENLHPVCNPAIDGEGNIFVTFSGARGQKTPVSLYRVDTNYSPKAWNTELVNPSGLAFDQDGWLYVSCRHDGTIHRLSREVEGAATLFCEGLGAATGLAFDRDHNLYVGDRSGTVFKIDQQRKTFVFATLEPSVAAYHLAFGPDQHLYVCGPSTSSYDTIWRISPSGEVEPFFRGLGRPQGMAFDAEGALYVVASCRGRRGVVRLRPGSLPEMVVAGQGLVGLAFARGRALVLATQQSLYHLQWPVAGAPLPPRTAH